MMGLISMSFLSSEACQGVFEFPSGRFVSLFELPRILVKVPRPTCLLPLSFKGHLNCVCVGGGRMQKG